MKLKSLRSSLKVCIDCYGLRVCGLAVFQSQKAIKDKSIDSNDSNRSFQKT